MEEPVFDMAGTQEQLGYQVSMTFRNTFGVSGLSVTVNTQANKFQRIMSIGGWKTFSKLLSLKVFNKENVSQAIQSC